MKRLYLILVFSMLFLFSSFPEGMTYKIFAKEFDEAIELFNQSKLEESLEKFDALVKDDYAKKYPNVFSSRASVLYRLGRYDEAKKDIDYCIPLKPDSVKLILMRSFINTKLKDYDAALSDVDFCLEKYPLWSDAYQQKGLIFLYMKDYAKAFACFEQTISLAKEIKPDYFANRGFAYYYLQDYEKAKEDFLSFLSMSENDDVYLCLVDLCYKLQQYDEGIKYANILINRGHRSDEAIIERAYIYLVQERYDEVKQDLDLLKKSCDDKTSYHKVKGIYFILVGEINSAAKELDKAKKLNQNDADIILLQKLLNSDKKDVLQTLNSVISPGYEL